MNQYITQLLGSNKALTAEEMLVQILMATLIGGVIYISYMLSHVGTVYSKKFNISLVMMTILTATVMSVIGNNVALSLGMVGALSIVRYRTAIKDSRDTAYIFWAIIVGISCGAGDFIICAIGSSAVFIVLLLFGRIKNDNSIMLIINANVEREREIESLVFSLFKNNGKMCVKNTTAQRIELIYQIPRKNYEQANSSAISITNQFYKIDGVDSVNAVLRSDDIV